MGIEDQRVTRDTGRFLVGLAETAVDDIELAVRADRRLSLFDIDRSVAVDDVAALGIETKLMQDHFGSALLPVKDIVRVARLFPG